ncbi:unnamed protein product [Amoebophrya sp. A120]|nr:unnamed protein product [Amoebophrya sp. A120]|eukprot:GSA120T00006161001.1
MSTGYDLGSLLGVGGLPEQLMAGRYNGSTSTVDDASPFALCMPTGGDVLVHEFLSDVLNDEPPTDDDTSALAGQKMARIVSFLAAATDNLRTTIADVDKGSSSTLKKFAETGAFHRSAWENKNNVRVTEQVDGSLRLALVGYRAACCPRSQMAVDACSAKKHEQIMKVCREWEPGWEPAGIWTHWSPDHFQTAGEEVAGSEPSHYFSAQSGDRFSWAVMTISSILSACGWVPGLDQKDLNNARATLLFGFDEDPDKGPDETHRPSKDNAVKLLSVKTGDGVPAGAVWQTSDQNGDGVALLNKLASIEGDGDDEQGRKFGEVSKREIMARCRKFGKKMKDVNIWGNVTWHQPPNVEKVAAAIESSSISTVIDGESGWAAIAKALLGVENESTSGAETGAASTHAKKWSKRYEWGIINA